MKNLFTPISLHQLLKPVIFLFALFLTANGLLAQSATWNLTTSNTPVVCGSVTATTPTNGASLTNVTSVNATSGYSATNFSTSFALPVNGSTYYIQYKMTNTAATAITITNVNFSNYYNGPTFMYLAIRYSTNNFSTSTALYQDVEVDPGVFGFNGTASISVAAGATVSFRVYGYFSDGTTYRFGNTFFQVFAGPAAPGTFTATAISGTQINLAGTANAAGNNVMLVYNTVNVFDLPAAGTAYVAGNTMPFGNGTVLYVGAAGSPFFNHTGLTPGTTYFYRLYSKVPTCNLYSAPLSASATTPYAYCIPTSTTPGTVYINKIGFVGTLQDVSNTSGYTTGFQNFTGLTPKAIQAQGQGVNVYVQSNLSTLIKAWVDWNNSNVFDAAELVYTSNGTLTSTTTFGFVIPPATLPGNYTIRIRTTYSGATTYGACGNLPDGEAEDYKFTVIANCPASITSITPGEVCGSGPVTLGATAGTGFTFRWYNAATGGTLLASTATGSWTTPSLGTTTTYYVAAYNGSCESIVRTPIVAKVSPVPVLSFAPTAPVVCGEGAVLQLNASGDTEEGILINEKFEGTGLGTFSVVNINITPATSVSAAQWQQDTSTYVPANTTVWKPAISSGFGTNKFAYATSDIANTTVNTALVSPVVNSTGYTSLALNFDVFYSHYLADNNTSIIDSLIVEVATNPAGSNWTRVGSYVADQGIGTKFVNNTITLNTYINSTTLKVRFRYYGVWVDGLSIDNIKLSGTKPLSTSFSWSPTGNGNLFTDAAGTIAYTGGSVPNIYIKPTTAQLSAGTNLTFTATATLSNGCFASTPVTVAIGPSQWTGAFSNDWFNINNWCSKTIPTSTTVVDIPAASTNYPVITAAASSGKITIEAGASLTISTAGSLTVYGDFNNIGALANNGKITLAANTTQNFPGAAGTITAMSTLQINNTGSGVILNKSIFVDKELKPTAGNLALGNFDITIRSAGSLTASVSAVGASAGFTYGNGRFVIERYIPAGVTHGKSWQLLAAPAIGKTIHETWMENASPNANPNPGYGTQITGVGGTGNGFDFASNFPSMKIYVPLTNDYVTVGNPSSTQINNPQGYFIFIRGDRSVINFSGAGSTPVPTKLRTTGTIKIGACPSPMVTAGLFQTIANPYPSAIDFSTVNRTGGVDPNFYLYDPTLYGSYGYGGYQTITAATGYLATPGNVATTSTIYNTTSDYRNIQSGQAFLVRATSTSGNLNFAETNKASGSTLVNRPASSASTLSMLSTNLLMITNQETRLADGNRVVFDDNFNNNVDGNDALKLMNTAENFGLLRNNAMLAVEARKTTSTSDTFFYQMSGLQPGNYKLMFVPQNLSLPGLSAELTDHYLNSKTSISLIDTDYVDVTITADPLCNKTDRFMLIFKTDRSTLPVSFISIASIRNRDNTNTINWVVANETEIENYFVERSADGRSFTPIATISANRNSSYTQNDLQPFKGNNFYRIQAIDKNGMHFYSRIVKTGETSEPKGITIFPNPVVGRTIQVAFSNKIPGMRNLQLINKNGEVVYIGTAMVNSNNFSKTISLNPATAAGVYQLKVTGTEADETILQVILP